MEERFIFEIDELLAEVIDLVESGENEEATAKIYAIRDVIKRPIGESTNSENRK